MLPSQEEAKILVASEDDPTRQLLETKISKDDGYQKQQGRARVNQPCGPWLIGSRHTHRLDRAEWHRHGSQFPGARGLRQYMVHTRALQIGEHTLTLGRDFVNDVQSRLQALAQGMHLLRDIEDVC